MMKQLYWVTCPRHHYSGKWMFCREGHDDPNRIGFIWLYADDDGTVFDVETDRWFSGVDPDEVGEKLLNGLPVKEAELFVETLYAMEEVSK